MQGPHHEAQKSSRITFPFSDFFETVLPVVVVIENVGRLFPISLVMVGICC